MTNLFEWAEGKGLDIPALAKALGYSERHLYRVKGGDYPVTRGLICRVVFVFGDDARSLFLPDASVINDDTAIVQVIAEGEPA